jgi:hypothetical protein
MGGQLDPRRSSPPPPAAHGSAPRSAAAGTSVARPVGHGSRPGLISPMRSVARLRPSRRRVAAAKLELARRACPRVVDAARSGGCRRRARHHRPLPPDLPAAPDRALRGRPRAARRPPLARASPLLAGGYAGNQPGGRAGSRTADAVRAVRKPVSAPGLRRDDAAHGEEEVAMVGPLRLSAVLASTDLARSQAFYEQTVGLPPSSQSVPNGA